jgi:hypothetical protein
MVTGKKRSGPQKFALIMCAAIFFVFIVLSPLLLLLPTWLEKRAYGDGLAQEQISSSLGSRKADLLIKMTPSVITDETLQKGQNPVVEFRLFDSNTNNSFSHVTYYITIEKDGKKLLSNWFHAHNGDLVMEIKPSRNATATTTTTNSVVNIAGQQEPLLGSYIGTTNDPVIVTGPIFLNSGLYHFIVRVATVDSDTGVLPADQQRIYESWFSIGNTKHEQIDIDGKNIPIKIVSYYDRLNNFTFDNKSKQMQFDMPFNWDMRRINNTSIFVHEEVYIPKPNAFTANKSLSGTVNGINVSKDIMIDPSQPDKDVIHVMLPKDTIIQLANQVNKNGGQGSSNLMNFALHPTSSNNRTTMGGGGGMMPSSSMGNMSMPMPGSK